MALPKGEAQYVCARKAHRERKKKCLQRSREKVPTERQRERKRVKVPTERERKKHRESEESEETER